MIQVPTQAEILFQACSHDLRVLSCVHADPAFWASQLTEHILHHSPCPADCYSLKMQWASTLLTIVHPDFSTFEEAVTAIAWCVRCMNSDSLIQPEEREDFIRVSTEDYESLRYRFSSKRKYDEV